MKLRHYFSIVTIFLMLLFVIYGCKKEPETESISKTAILTSHVWNFSDLTTSSTSADVQSSVSLMKALMTNATLSFSSSGTYIMTVFGQSASGQWVFNQGETAIVMDKGTADEYEEIVVQITSSILELKENIKGSGYGDYSLNYKWIK